MSLAEAQWVIDPALKKYAFPRFPHIDPSSDILTRWETK
jgi:hypothetical protein